jgi:hypothetical protein
MTKPFKSETRYRGDWAVTIYRSEANNGFFTKCVSPTGAEFCTEVFIDKGSAWQSGYNYVDQVEREECIRRYRAVVVPLTLALLYVSGWDEYYEYVSPPKFRGRRAWKNHDWDILNFLTDQNFLEEQLHPKQIKSVVLTPKGIKQAKLALHKIGLPGIQDFFGAEFELDDEDQIDEHNQKVNDE